MDRFQSRGGCDLSSHCHSPGAADADGHRSHEQSDTEQGRQGSKRDHTTANCPHFDKTCRKCGKVCHLAHACRSSGPDQQPKAKGGGKEGKGGKGAGAVKTFWNCGEHGTCPPSVRRRRFLRSTITLLQGKSAARTPPSVCAGEVVDIEVDSGAEVSCLSASIGVDTYSLHETRLSMCGGHHIAAGGGKLHELGARILGLEAGDVRGEVVNLL